MLRPRCFGVVQATVVLANGSIVTASKCSHPDLFASIRGGGGGAAGVVVDFVAKSHAAPKYTTTGGFKGNASTYEECLKLTVQVRTTERTRDEMYE